MEDLELIIDQLFPALFLKVIPVVADSLVYQSLKEVFYPTKQANYLRMDYLADRGYDVPKLLDLSETAAKGYREHLTIRNIPKERHYNYKQLKNKK